MKSLKRALEKLQVSADENFRRAKKAESKIVEFEEDSKGRALIKQKPELAKGVQSGDRQRKDAPLHSSKN